MQRPGMKSTSFIFGVLFCTWVCTAQSQQVHAPPGAKVEYKTIVGGRDANNSQSSISVSSNQVAVVVGLVLGSPQSRTGTIYLNGPTGGVNLNADSFNDSDIIRPVSTFGALSVAGPGSISVSNSTRTQKTLATIMIITLPTEQTVPSNSVVVPADNAGPVEIILEQSSDLINWTVALPGTYGTTTEKRFFRVRAVRK